MDTAVNSLDLDITYNNEAKTMLLEWKPPNTKVQNFLLEVIDLKPFNNLSTLISKQQQAVEPLQFFIEPNEYNYKLDLSSNFPNGSSTERGGFAYGILIDSYPIYTVHILNANYCPK